MSFNIIVFIFSFDHDFVSNQNSPLSTILVILNSSLSHIKYYKNVETIEETLISQNLNQIIKKHLFILCFKFRPI